MKFKFFTFFLMAASMVTAAAEVPRTIEIGENSCDLPNFSPGSSSVAYTYTNTSSEGQLLSLSDEGQFYNITAKQGETYVYNVYSLDKGKRIYAIDSGDTVDFEISPQTSHLSFTASVQDGVNTAGGKTVDEPIIIGDGDLYVPCYYDWEQYVANPAYFKYTATMTGVLSIRYVGTLDAKFGLDKDPSQWTVLTQQDNGDGTSALNVPVEEGNTYYMSMECYNAVLADVHVQKMVEGSSPETAMAAQMGENNLPEDSGTFWWKITPDFDGYLVARSSAEIGETGMIIIRDDMHDNIHAQSVNGMIAIRHMVESGKTYWIGITKGSTAEGDQFSLTSDLNTADDSAENPIELDGAGNYVTPEYNGTYYYKIAIPAQMRDKYICVETNQLFAGSTTAVLSIADINVRMKNGFIRLEADGNETATLRWDLGEGINNITFSVYFADIEDGDKPDTAIAAVLGENQLPVGREKYFSYTPAKKTWLAVKPADEKVKVQFCERRGGYMMNLSTVTENGWVKTRLTNIRENLIYICFSSISEATTFELEEPDFAAGEVFDNPLPAVLGDNEVPESDERYYSYTPKESCRLGIKVPESVLMSFYKLVEPEDGEPYYVNDWSTTEKDGFQLYEALGGKPCVISLSYVNAPVVMTLKEFALEPGDGRSSAIEIGQEGTSIDVPDQEMNKWYKYEMPGAGYLSVESDMDPEGMIGFGGNNIEVFLNDETNGTSMFNYDSSSFNSDLAAFPGDVAYINVSNNIPNGEKYVKVSFKEPEELTLGYNDLPTISYFYGFRWYSYEAEAGTVTLTSELETSDFEIYANGDFSAPAATTEAVSQFSSKVTYKVEDKQRLYFLCRRYTPGSGLLLSFEPTVSVDAVGAESQIVCQAVPGGVLVKSPETSAIAIFDASGRIVYAGNLKGERTIALASGLYVIKTGERVFKVMI